MAALRPCTQLHCPFYPAGRPGLSWRPWRRSEDDSLALRSVPKRVLSAWKGATCQAVRERSARSKSQAPLKVVLLEQKRWSRRVQALVKQLEASMPDITDEELSGLLDRWAKSTRPERRDMLLVLKALDCTAGRLLCCRVSEWALSQEWFEANVRDFATLLDRYGKNSRLEEMEATFHRMQENGFPADLVAYTIMISAWGRGGQMAKAVEYFQDMKAHGIEPDLMTYSSVMSAYGEGGSPEKAEEVLREIENAGLGSSRSYTVLIAAYGRKLQPQEASRIFREMQTKAKIIPDTKAYTALMDAFIKAGDLEKAKSIFQTMKEVGVPIDDAARALLVEAFGRADRCSEAVQLVLEAEKGSIRAGVNTYAALITVFGLHGLLEEAQEVFDEMVAAKQPLGRRVYAALFCAYAAAGREESAMELYRKMEDGGWMPTRRQYTEMIEALLEGGLKAAAQSLLDTWRQLGPLRAREVERMEKLREQPTVGLGPSGGLHKVPRGEEAAMAESGYGGNDNQGSTSGEDTEGGRETGLNPYEEMESGRGSRPEVAGGVSRGVSTRVER